MGATMSSRALLAAFGLAPLLLAGVACAPGTSVPGVDDVEQEDDSLGTAQRSYVTVRRDFRKCAWPMCGGWWVQDVNRKNPKEAYVVELDFSEAGFDEATIGQATGGAELGEVVLWGKLADLADWDDPAMKIFRAKRAWRGMPGQGSVVSQTFWATAAIDPPIQCFTAPCATLEVTPLHHPSQGAWIEGVSLDALVEPLLDRAWLQGRIAGGRALVTGEIVEGEEFPGGPEHLLAATQVLIELPEGTEDCPQSKPACDWDAGEAATYVRDADRCVVLDQCVLGGACTQQVPACLDGYSLVSWTGGLFACTVYACDPAFLVPEEPIEG
jgi:hypothetical protein